MAEVAHAIDSSFAEAGPAHRVWPTVSYGAALWDQRSSLDDLIERADHALYEAKGRGRAQTVIDEVSA